MSLSERMSARDGVYRRDAIVNLRTILNKGDAATEDDLVLLASVTKFLGKSAEVINDEHRACEQAKKLRRMIADIPMFQEKSEKASVELKRIEPEQVAIIEAAKNEITRAKSVAANWDNCRFKSTNAKSKLQELVKQYPDAVTEDGPCAPESPINFGEMMGG